MPRRYQSHAIEAAQVIEELSALEKEMRAANAHGEQLGLTEDELAFYDALETNDSAVKVLCDTTLRALVRRILRKHGYPPDKQEKAADTMLKQVEALSAM